jgi:hypothetical protein
MRNSILIFTLLLFTACSKSIAETDLLHINGYWEIEKVILPDGETKDYKINENLDYFFIKKQSGFRKKVLPQLDGTYLTNDVEEKVKVSFEKGDCLLNYKTDFASWQEEVVDLTAEKLVLKSLSNNLVYHYKKIKTE